MQSTSSGGSNNTSMFVMLGSVLMFCGVASAFSSSGSDGSGAGDSKEAKKTHLIEEQRKEHSNKFYQIPPGMKLVEIDFAEELTEGDMRGLKVGDKPSEKVLIARYQGKLYATGSSCSHFGVDLSYGMLFDDKVMCPAHAAGFSVVTG